MYKCRNCSNTISQGTYCDRCKERRKLYNRKVRKQRKEDGLCSYCGCEIDDKKYKMCSFCRCKTRLRCHDYSIEKAEVVRKVNRDYAAKLRKYRKENDLCMNCGGERDDMYNYCSKCRAKYIEYGKKYRDRKKADNNE